MINVHKIAPRRILLLVIVSVALLPAVQLGSVRLCHKKSAKLPGSTHRTMQQSLPTLYPAVLSEWHFSLHFLLIKLAFLMLPPLLFCSVLTLVCGHKKK